METPVTVKPVSQPRKRKAVVPPRNITPEMTLFEYLSQCQPPLDEKIIDIACIQSQVPIDLRDDAGQEIRIMWNNTKPATGFYKPGQVASYAHRMAGHACLRVRREMASSVRLPGSAFRKKKDGTSYVTPGVLAAPLNWDDLETWYHADDNENSALGTVLADMGAESAMTAGSDDDTTQAVDSDQALINERLEMLNEHRDILTDQQVVITTRMVEGDTYEEIMADLDIKKGVLMRELNIVASVLGPSIMKLAAQG